MGAKTKIRILVYRPGQPSTVEEHLNSLEAQQELVGGDIESVSAGDGISLICNEAGKRLNLEPNFALPGDIVLGTVFFCRTKDAECASLTDADIGRIQAKVRR